MLTVKNHTKKSLNLVCVGFGWFQNLSTKYNFVVYFELYNPLYIFVVTLMPVQLTRICGGIHTKAFPEAK